jgi:hypothetical protein
MDTPKTDAAIAALPRGAHLLVRMSAPVYAVEYAIHAHEALRLGSVGQAAMLAGRGLDAYERRAPTRHAARWLAALRELAEITGAVRSPSVIVIQA